MPSESETHSRIGPLAAEAAAKRDWFDWGDGRASSLAANAKFVAAALEGVAGGQVLICPIGCPGKRDDAPRLTDHNAAIIDMKWSPFNDNVLATSSHDSTVKIWHISDNGSGVCVRTLTAHSKKVDGVEWHSTVDNVLLTAGADGKLALWDCDADRVVYEVSDFHAASISFNPHSSQFAATTKTTQRVCIFDARTGAARKSASVPHEGASRVHFHSASRLATCGLDPTGRRHIAVFNVSSLGAPLCVVDCDGSGDSPLTPFLDPDLSLLYLTAKTDAHVRVYELLERAPWVVRLADLTMVQAHGAVCHAGKRAVDVRKREIAKIYRLIPASLLVQPMAITAKEGNESDVHPMTRSPTPSMTLKEWLAGTDLPPVPLQLKPGCQATNKRVELRSAGEATSLTISDHAMDKKFRFLSQVTKPDYSGLLDGGERERKGRSEPAMPLPSKVTKNDSVSSMESRSEEEDEEDDGEQTTASQISYEPDRVGGGEDRARLTLPPAPKNTRERSPSLPPPSTAMLVRTASPEEDLEEEEEEEGGGQRERGVSSSSSSGCPVAMETADAGERNGNHDERSSSSGGDTVSDSRLLESAVGQLERELRKVDARAAQLQRIVEMQQTDIDSLRYEIEWKDARIDYLQKQLALLQPNPQPPAASPQ